MMMPNVAPAPMMAGTPMGGDLSEPMAPAQAELDPAEIQEAQGALMQIIQIIQMLVNQGMSEAEIQQFLAQYGITEEELDQAAAILGVDIDALMAGEQRMPMAQGGSLPELPVPQVSIKVNLQDYFTDSGALDEQAYGAALQDAKKKADSISNTILKFQKSIQTASNIDKKKLQEELDSYVTKIRQEFAIERLNYAAGGMTDPLAPASVPRTPDMMIFSINSDINNLMQEYNMAVRNNEFERAQAIADEIDGLQQQIINLQDSKVPAMSGLNMRFGGSATGK